MPFSKKTLDFLSQAGRQKDQEWLTKHQKDYLKWVKEPFTELACELKNRLALKAHGYHFPTKGIGRIKRPSHKIGKGEPVNKNYLSLSIAKPSVLRFEQHPHLFFGMFPNGPEFNGIIVAGGLYFPSSRQLRAIREAMANDATPFKMLLKNKAFKSRFKNGFDESEKQKKVPRGFDPESQDKELIKLKRFIVIKEIPIKLFSSKTFVDEVELDFVQALRLNVLLEKAIKRQAI